MKKLRKTENFISLFVFLLFPLVLFLTACRSATPDPVQVGILHSLSGTMAVSESPVVDAILMAIDEINQAGGVLGRRVEPIIVDARSDAAYAAEQAERLINEQGITTIFGCWTSACRRTVRPVIEQYNATLFYPVQYEGLEDSPNIVYSGITPNQQITIAAQWAFRFIGERFYLVGSDYIYPHAANEIVKEKISALGGLVVGESYLQLSETDVTAVVSDIHNTQPDVILNTINGDTNYAFFRGLREAGITSDQIPTMSFSIAEPEVQGGDPLVFAGDYAVWSYFESLENPPNAAFVAEFKDRYGADRQTSDPIEAAYTSVYIWRAAVEKADSFASQDIRETISGINLTSPQGIIRLDEGNLHIWKTVRVGQIDQNGSIEIVWESPARIRPEPYPQSRTKAEWEAFIFGLYNSWDQNWENPGK